MTSHSNPNSNREEQLKQEIWFGILLDFTADLRKLARNDKPLVRADRSPAYSKASEAILALITSQRQEAKREMADQLLTDLPVEPLESSRAEAADFRLAISATRDVINLAKANLDHQVQVNEDTDVLIKPDAGSDTDVTSKVAGKEVKFSHTAANLDIHMFIDGYHDPDVCPECIQPGLLVGSKS